MAAPEASLMPRKLRKRRGPKVRNWQETMNSILGRDNQRLSIHESKEEIRRHFHGLNRDGMPADAIRISLKCPVSMKRIKEAARGRACLHIDCFDLSKFLRMNARTPNWNCTFCKKVITTDSIDHDEGNNTIIIDEYLNAILRDKRASTVEQVDLLPDGTWEPVEGPRLLPSNPESAGDSDDDLQIVFEKCDAASRPNAQQAADSATMSVRAVKDIVLASTAGLVKQLKGVKRKRLAPVAEDLSVRIKEEIGQACKRHRSAPGASTQEDADDTVVAEAMSAESAANKVNDLREKIDELNEELRAERAAHEATQRTLQNQVNDLDGKLETLNQEVSVETAAHALTRQALQNEAALHNETTAASAELEKQLTEANSQIERLLADKCRRSRHVDVESLELSVANKSQEITSLMEKLDLAERTHATNLRDMINATNSLFHNLGAKARQLASELLPPPDVEADYVGEEESLRAAGEVDVLLAQAFSRLRLNNEAQRLKPSLLYAYSSIRSAVTRASSTQRIESAENSEYQTANVAPETDDDDGDDDDVDDDDDTDDVSGRREHAVDNDELPDQWKAYVATTFGATLQELRAKELNGGLTDEDRGVIKTELPTYQEIKNNAKYKGLFLDDQKTRLACPYCHDSIGGKGWNHHAKIHFKPFCCLKCGKPGGKKNNFYFHLKSSKDGADKKRLLCKTCFHEVIGSCEKDCRDKYTAQRKHGGPKEFAYKDLCPRCRKKLNMLGRTDPSRS